MASYTTRPSSTGYRPTGYRPNRPVAAKPGTNYQYPASIPTSQAYGGLSKPGTPVNPLLRGSQTATSANGMITPGKPTASNQVKNTGVSSPAARSGYGTTRTSSGSPSWMVGFNDEYRPPAQQVTGTPGWSAAYMQNLNTQAASRERALNSVGQTTGGGGSAGNSPWSEWQDAYDEAKATNEARYNDILGQYGDRYDRNMGYVEGMGTQERADINTQWNNERSAVGQDMVSRGLTGTTIKPSMEMGVERQRTAALGRLNDRLLQQKLYADMQLSGDKLGFMERREDEYPDPNLLAQLAQNYGQSGASTASAWNGVPIYADMYGNYSNSPMYQVPQGAWGGVMSQYMGAGQGGGGSSGGDARFTISGTGTNRTQSSQDVIARDQERLRRQYAAMYGAGGWY